MALHTEKTFEDEIISHLTSHGWHAGITQGYDTSLALYPADVIEWLNITQPKEVAKVRAMHNGDTDMVILKRLAEELDKRGALDVLRHGFKHINARFTLCQFKPNTTLNPTTLQWYQQVCCRVVRQLRYSRHHTKSIDLVFFVNGIPVATIELKTDFTQTVADAIEQYRTDRLPRDPVTKHHEPLLMFKRRALVHFAVSSTEVWMTTKLQGAQTRFLPFNQGVNGGAGNPVNLHGYTTSYLWEEVLNRESLLRILGSFMQIERDKKRQETLIFPRYHQLQVINQLMEVVRREGLGHAYLIQHSAGSGKSNSIAWLAHQLSGAYDDQNQKLVDSVIVVTDRTVLDEQLAETIYQFDHTQGVVKQIERSHGSKSQALAEALLTKTPIIIVTIQTFPFVLEHIQQDSHLRSHRFAVIADEAHTSQTSASSSELARVLSTPSDEEDYDIEDILLDVMEQRANHRNISYFAFTATPKARTLEKFGRVPNPNEPRSETNLPAAFHVYTMQQAIEEGYILDVLQNYTSYSIAYKLAYQGQEIDATTIDKQRGWKQLMNFVQLHPTNISQTVQIILHHFQHHVRHLLNGQAKAMVVADSRKQALAFKRTMDTIIHDYGYPMQTLVAFSGDIFDDATQQMVNERSLNPALKGMDIREAFKGDYHILIVANKYQTGFDQPLLCAMYVHKRLDGITAVQTLSRLNRTYPGKDATFVFDFVNDPQTILAAFKPYYREATITTVSDPNTIHMLQAKLDAAQLYTSDEVDRCILAIISKTPTQRQLQASLAPAVQRFHQRWQTAMKTHNQEERDSLTLFRKDVKTFLRHYAFLSQIFNYADTDLEKRALFLRYLSPLLHGAETSEAINLSGVTMTHYRSIEKGTQTLNLNDGSPETLKVPNALGSGGVYDPDKATLEQIIATMNSLFEGQLSDADLISYVHHIRDKMLENTVLAQQASHNSKAQFALGDFQRIMMETIINAFDSYQDMTQQVLKNEQTQKGFSHLLLDVVYSALRQGSNR